MLPDFYSKPQGKNAAGLTFAYKTPERVQIERTSSPYDHTENNIYCHNSLVVLGAAIEYTPNRVSIVIIQVQ